MITLTMPECEAVFDLINQLTGGAPETVFGALDDLDDPLTSACVKIYRQAGVWTPARLIAELDRRENRPQP